MFANSMIGGMDLGFPDVCRTPLPPIPWPNAAFGPIRVPVQFSYLLKGLPWNNLLDFAPMSFFDELGLGLGLLCPTVKAPQRHYTGMFTFIVRAAPSTRMTSLGISNMFNCPFSMRTLPSQFNYLLVGP
ncbi:type VI secretion protein [Oligella sp. HMSC05A10]|uniref:PAAR-like domain-containing protein n=1 Tax=Oligella TaxID=90243 RepID=UPI0008A646DA|nr:MULTISPECIES: PAAR-like domain-containing protein [Oligella]OFS87050.1 type VI secretion protein [Oligella sp. HMSC05A10]SUA59709.1 Uncharacterised protein [Oligella urethralis]